MSRLSPSDATHERARLLAAEAVDGALDARDAAWLADHLAGCADCRAAAAEFQAIRQELRALAVPEPPRDLWARTAAALDQVDRARGSRRRSSPAVRGRLARLGLAAPSLLGTAAAVGIVVLVVGVSFIGQLGAPQQPHPSNGQPASVAIATPRGPSSAPPQQLAMASNKVYSMQVDGSGLYAIKENVTKCASASGPSCTIVDESGKTLGVISSRDGLSAVVAPNARQALVWTDDKVVVMPLAPASPASVSMDLITPQPSIAATPTFTSASPSAPPGTSATPSAIAASFTPSAPPSSAPPVTPPASPSGATSPSVAPASPSGTPSLTSSPSASATPVTNAIPILANYEILGTPQFSPDGSRLAFTARPVDRSAGPDVFVWRTGDATATQLTSSHAAVFSAWSANGRMLISQVGVESAGNAPAAPAASVTASPSAATVATATSFVVDPASGSVLEIERSMYLPVTDASGAFLVYWSGTLTFDPGSGLWQPDAGSLYFDSWSNMQLTSASLAGGIGGTATPAASQQPSGATASASATAGASASATAPAGAPSPSSSDSATASASTAVQPSATTSGSAAETPVLPELLPASADADGVQRWAVAWDGSGHYIAIWVADPGSQATGRLSLFAVDRGAGLVNTSEPLLAAPATSTFQFDGTQLAYTSPANQGGGKTNLVKLPELPAPSSPLPTVTPGATSSSPSATDTSRPGR